MPKLGGRCPLNRVENPVEYMREGLKEFYIAQNAGLPTSPLSNLPTYARISDSKKTIVKTDGEDVGEIVKRAVLNNNFVDEILLKQEYCRRACVSPSSVFC